MAMPIAAYEVWKDDVRVDAAFTSLFRELLTYMMEDPRSITACTHLLFMAKNIEHIGDHATNIAENVWYVVKGSQLEAPQEVRRQDHHPGHAAPRRSPLRSGSRVAGKRVELDSGLRLRLRAE